VIARSDYLSLHLPLTPATKGFLNAGTLALARDGLRVLNFARADLVDSADLLAALASGRVAAYVVDFPTDEMIGVPGVTAIPHLGASTPESENNCAVMAARQVAAYLERGEVVNSVNLPQTRLPALSGTRVCVVHKGPAADILAALGGAKSFVSNTRGDVSYTVADIEGGIAPSALEALEGVIRVRVLKG